MSRQYLHDNNTNCQNTIESYNTVYNNCTVVDDRSEILEWISPLKPNMRHQDIRIRRVKDVGDWVLQTEEYRSWHDGSSGISSGGESGSAALFCCGGPGVGKTYVSSLVIDSLCDQAEGRNVAVACFYFDYADRKEQTPTRVLCALLKQIVAGLEVIPEVIIKAFRDQKKVLHGRELSLDKTLEIWQAISSSHPTFICLDALDECMAEHRLELLVALRQVLQTSPGTRIFLTGRPQVQYEIQKHLSRRALIVPITPKEADVVRFLDTALEKDNVSDAMDSSLKEDILKSIPEGISETFLLVALNIEAILREPTIYRRREKLKEMKNGFGLEAAYGATLDRIKAQGGEKARIGIAALMWITHSQRPLRASELCHALSVEVGSSTLNLDNIPSISTLLNCCQGLVAVDKDVSTVRLIHLTLQEYFSTHSDFFGQAHSKMAETTLTYLNFQFITDLPAHQVPDPQEKPFLEYSSLHWGTHARMGLSDCAKGLTLKLLDQYDNHVSAVLLFRTLWKKIQYSWRTVPSPHEFTALHCISFFGIVEIAFTLTKMKRWHRDQADCAGMTPLLWAARSGHEEMVRLLVRKGLAEPDFPDTKYGRTALSWAAGNGREGVVKYFLGRDFINPDYSNNLLGKAQGAVGVLFGKKYLNPDKPDTDAGQTPISWAARNGQTEVVKQLLERGDVDPNRPDTEYGRTPLPWAASNGHIEVVELLLERGNVDPNRPDTVYGRTPLSWAASNGHTEVVELLLRREDVDPNNPGTVYGRTPLSWAASGRHTEVVELLLGRGDVDPNGPDTVYGRTPLWWAASNWHTEVVELLLGRGDVDPNRPDNIGQTPLSLAARNGWTEVVKLLLERRDVDPNRPDTRYGQTPLSWAAENGWTEVVELLLRRGDVDPNRPNNTGRTPLSWAAENGRTEVVELLLRRGDVDPNRPDNSGETPLSLAAKRKHTEVLKLL